MSWQLVICSTLMASCAINVVNGCIIRPHTDCRRANLSGSNLSGANLFGADLSDADLRGATLDGAYMRWTDLRGADLREATLNEVDLRMALYDTDTVWPIGLEPDDTGAMLVLR